LGADWNVSLGQQTAIAGEKRVEIVEKIADILDKNYVFPEIGKEMGDLIKKKLKAGEYERISKAYTFAGKLTSDLREVSKDLHLRVIYDPKTASVLIKNLKPSAEEMKRLRAIRQKRQIRENFGFMRVERLPGNIGYIDFRYFADPADAKNTAASAMGFLAHSDAVILDLRNNGGGSPQMVQFICSYFFGPEPVHLNSLYWRRTNRTQEFWTHRKLPGKRMPEVDLYVLTSRRTFSGAEECTYNLKTRKRAVIIGETTGGGAHPTDRMAVDENLLISVPVGRAINPITKTNWEGVGVKPDIEVPRAEAFLVAQVTAIKKMIKNSSDKDWKITLASHLIRLEADLENMRLKRGEN
jgi:C-terminal processing protease CtpA/Prc